MGKRGRPKGHRLSEEIKRKIAKSKTGHTHSQKTKDAIAASLITYFDRTGRKGCIMPSKKLLPGNYPQAPAEMCHLNVNKWSMSKWRKNGQEIKELRFKEITYGHDQSKDWLHEEVNPEFQSIFRLPGQLGSGFSRVSTQSKLSLGTIDVTHDNLVEIEMSIRKIMDTQFGIDDAYAKDRLLLTHIIFEKDGADCKWEVAEKGDGLALVLTKVNGKSVSDMTLANAQKYADGISDCLCEAKRVIREPREGTACPYSAENIRLIG